MQELGKFNLKINVIPYGLEKYRSFSVNEKLRFIDGFQFLRFSLDSLVQNLSNDGFKYQDQESEVNYWIKLSKRNYPYQRMSDMKKIK